VWVDAANLDIRSLLDQAEWLAAWRDDGVTVEFGQRRKPVRWTDGRPGLAREPTLGPWWQTWSGDIPTPVWIPVGGFSQPSLRANRLLVARVLAAATATGASQWDELGAGAGNLTVPLAALGQVRSIESDAIACAGWRQTTRGLAGVSLDEADLRTAEIRAQAVLADPPRSGLGAAVGAITGSDARHLVLVSCATDALARDAAALRAAGWEVAEAEGVDQFPRSAAVEWITRWRR
jgi:23S rRNA (uracil1939-C5)-methyltransferase